MSSAGDILVWAVVLGLSSVAFTKCLRAVRPVAKWTLDAKKPWACDICMSFWGVLLLSGGLYGLWRESLAMQPFVTMVAWCVSYFGLQKLSEPMTRFELPPPLEDSEPGERLWEKRLTLGDDDVGG